MKTRNPIFLMQAFILLSVMTCFAQPEIVTIDGIYVERDTMSFRLNKKPIVSDDVIVFDIPGFGEYLEESKISINDVVLMVENIPLTEMPAYIENLESGIVRFEFTQRDLTSEHRQLLFAQKGEAAKKLRLGIKAGEDIVLYYSPKGDFYFEDIKNWKSAGIGLIVGFVLLFVILIVKFPSFLKETIPSQFQQAFQALAASEPPESPEPSSDTTMSAPITARPLEDIKKNLAYSFSKSQLVFWTIIIISSFIYIWSLTGDHNPINTTALILLGISTATTAAGSIVNGRQEAAATPTQQTQMVTTPTAATFSSITEVRSSVVAFLESRLSDRSFFRDILSDNQGINIHRFQSFIFNILYGVIFLKAVIIDYAMPSFGDVELALLGISNGTYAFLKTSENK